MLENEGVTCTRILGGLPILALVWTSEWFFTHGAAAQFLNTLPAERALEAKVSCAPGSGCTVFFRIERDLKVPVDTAR